MAPLVCGAKTTACRRPCRVDGQIFYPPRGFGQQRSAELRRGASRSDPIQASAAIASGPHRAVRRHRHRQKSRVRFLTTRCAMPSVPGAADSGAAKSSLTVGPQSPDRQSVQPAPAAARKVSWTWPRVAAKRCTAPDRGPGSSTAARAKAALGARTRQRLRRSRYQQTRVVTSTSGPRRLTALIPRRTTPVPTRRSPQVVRYTRVSCAIVLGSKVLATSTKVTLLRSGAMRHGLGRDSQGGDGGLLKGRAQGAWKARVGKSPRGVRTRDGRWSGPAPVPRRREQGGQAVAVFGDHGLLVEGQQVIEGRASRPGGWAH